MRWLVLLVTIVTIAVNAFANTGRINGVTTGMVANRYDTPVTPAGYVFAIWGLIYLALAAFAAWQVAGSGARCERAATVRAPYIFSGAANMAWLLLWHHERLAASFAVMLLLALALAQIWRSLRAGQPASRLEWWCLDAPFSLYCGWITVAALANLGVVATAAAWLPAGWGPAAGSVALVAVATLLGIAAAAGGRDAIFAAVVAWAAAGIALKPGQLPLTMAASGLAVVVLVPVAAITAWRRWRAAPAAEQRVENR